MGESDWDRNFMELGLVVGWIFVALRIVFALWLLLIGVRAARSGDPMSLLLASFAAFAIFQGQITMHTAYAHLAWFAVGLTMAAARAAWAPGAAQAVGTATMRPRRGNVSWPPPVKPPISDTPQWGRMVHRRSCTTELEMRRFGSDVRTRLFGRITIRLLRSSAS